MHFDLKKRLGAGHFGEVWLAVDTALNTERAVKLIPKNKVPDPANFFREAQLLKTAEHENIVHVETSGTMPAPDNRIFVAMELLPKGSLDDEAKGGYVLLTRAKRIMIDVLRGLEWAHSKGIIHHDIKPANILIGQANQGKLSDFGLAIQPSIDPSTIGVKNYDYLIHVAPEISSKKDYTVSSDIYACGVTLYRLVNGDSYLPTVSPRDAADLAAVGKYPDRTKYRAFVPRSLRMVINKAMAVNPSDRFKSAEEMRRALEQVRIEMNWNENHASDHTKWISGNSDRCYEVILQNDATSWSISVRKGESKRDLRRINKHCREALTKEKAKTLVAKILQGFVSGTIS